MSGRPTVQPHLSLPPHDERGGMHRTGRFDALGWDFAVQTDDLQLGRHIEVLFGSLSVAGDPRRVYSLYARTAAAPRWRLLLGDDLLLDTGSPSRALAHLVWHVNRSAIWVATDTYVALHAAAASIGEVGLVLPAPEEAGKTTLVAGLLQAGFGYLSDEVAAVDAVSLRLRPYPKPLSIDPGSWDVLRALEPVLPPELERYLSRQWQVPPTAVRPDAVSPSVAARLVVAPRYERGARTRLVPAPRAQMLRLLAEQTFHLERAGRRNLTVLGALAQSAGCYWLTVGDLDRACDLLLELVGEVAADVSEPSVKGSGAAPATSGSAPATSRPGRAPRARSDLVQLVLDGEAVLYDEQRGDLHLLDAIGTVVWQLLDGSTSLHSIVAELADAFSADRQRVDADVMALVRALREQGLLVLRESSLTGAVESREEAREAPLDWDRDGG